MGFQITLFLTLAIYTSQFQEELPVWQKQTNTPLLTYTGSGFIYFKTKNSHFYSFKPIEVIVCVVVNAGSCIVTAIALMIYHLGEEQVYMPNKCCYK